MIPNLLIAAEPAAPAGMSAVIAAMDDVFSLVGTVITSITGQPILLFLLAAGLSGVGIAMFRKLKNVAR